MNREKAMINDERIFQCATYSKTQGLTRKASRDEIMEVFACFKKRVKAGKMTVDELEDWVFGNYGVTDGVQSVNIMDVLTEHLNKSIGIVNEQAKKKKRDLRGNQGHSQTDASSNQNDPR